MNGRVKSRSIMGCEKDFEEIQESLRLKKIEEAEKQRKKIGRRNSRMNDFRRPSARTSG